jgi:hypothetical protein
MSPQIDEEIASIVEETASREPKISQLVDTRRPRVTFQDHFGHVGC